MSKLEYTLTISQRAIALNFPELDLKDAAIIDFLGRFAHSQAIQKRFLESKVFYWFDYGHIQDQNPLLKLEAESIRKRMRAMCRLKILEAHPDNQGGKPYFAFGEKYEYTHREVRANAPEVGDGDFGQMRPKHRANAPEVGDEVRANAPDNQKTNEQGHQSGVGDKSPANGKKKKELKAPNWMVKVFDEKYQTVFPEIGRFHWMDRHFGANGLSGIYSRLNKRQEEKAAAGKGPEPTEEILQMAWASFLEVAAKIEWIKKGFYTPCDLYTQFDKIGQEWLSMTKKEKAKTPGYIPPEIPVYQNKQQ